MRFFRIGGLWWVAACVAAAAVSTNAVSQEKIRIGIIGQFSGPFAYSGKEYQQGIQAYMATYGSRVGGREVEVLYRDVGGTNSALAKQLTQELIVKDNVSIIGGFYLSPEALAAAPILTETKTPAVVFNGAAKAITEASPYIIRSGSTMFQSGLVEADWAIKHGYKRAYVSVSDYAPGYDFMDTFRKRYTQLGGTILGEDKIPLNTVDYSPFVERVARAKPDVLVEFIPGGAPSVSLVKALEAQGMTGRSDLAIVGQGQLQESDLRLFDDSVVGLYDVLAYAIDAPTDENRKYKEKRRAMFGSDDVPNYAEAIAWDAMNIMYQMIRSQQGQAFDGTAAVKAVLGYKFEGAKGTSIIEPDTRNVTLDMYVRRVIKGPDGKLKLEISDTGKGVKSLP